MKGRKGEEEILGTGNFGFWNVDFGYGNLYLNPVYSLRFIISNLLNNY